MKLPVDTFPFLNELTTNNNREWFAEQKPRFQALQSELIDFIDVLIGTIIPIDPMLIGVEAKNCLFRIHKDARFSKDKTPYKTHFGIHIVSSGRRSDFDKAGFYLHIEPNASMIGGGAHSPSPAWLKKIRTKIVHDGDALEAILANTKFKKCFGGIKGEHLTRPPQGFAKDAPHIELLRQKALWVQHDIDDELLCSAQFIKHYAQTFAIYQPFQQFLNQA